MPISRHQLIQRKERKKNHPKTYFTHLHPIWNKMPHMRRHPKNELPTKPEKRKQFIQTILPCNVNNEC